MSRKRSNRLILFVIVSELTMLVTGFFAYYYLIQYIYPQAIVYCVLFVVSFVCVTKSIKQLEGHKRA